MRLWSAVSIALLFVSGAALAQDDDMAKLDELRTTGKPRQQDDLNTYRLASAHREQARSIDEKTNGLFQSWLVSICQGCGVDVQPAAKEDRAEDAPPRSQPMTTGAVTTGAVDPDARRPEGAKPAVAPERRSVHATIAADLSPGAITSIRRMPRQSDGPPRP